MEELLSVIREAIKQVPAMRYALAVIGLLAVVVLATRFNIGPTQAIVGPVIVLVGMVLVFVFSTLTSLSKSDLRLPSLVLVWTVLLFSIAGGAIGFWSAFIGPDKVTGSWLTRGNASNRSSASESTATSSPDTGVTGGGGSAATTNANETNASLATNDASSSVSNDAANARAAIAAPQASAGYAVEPSYGASAPVAASSASSVSGAREDDVFSGFIDHQMKELKMKK